MGDPVLANRGCLPTGRRAARSLVGRRCRRAATGAAMEVYAALLTDLQMSDRLVVPDLVYVSVLGICRTGLPETRTIVVISGVLAHALITVGGGFGDVPTVLSAARSAIANGGRPLADVLPHAATEVLRTYEKSIFSNARRSTAPGAGSTLPGGGQGHDSSRHLGAALMSSGDVGVHVTVSALPPVAQHARTWWATGCRRGRRVDRTRVRKTVTVVNKVGGVRLSSPPALSATPFRPCATRVVAQPDPSPPRSTQNPYPDAAPPTEPAPPPPPPTNPGSREPDASPARPTPAVFGGEQVLPPGAIRTCPGRSRAPSVAVATASRVRWPCTCSTPSWPTSSTTRSTTGENRDRKRVHPARARRRAVTVGAG